MITKQEFSSKNAVCRICKKNRAPRKAMQIRDALRSNYNTQQRKQKQTPTATNINQQKIRNINKGDMITKHDFPAENEVCRIAYVK